ncbi:Prevent-host-death family protein [Alloalcanivorax dieselolei B5]|uniref:Prevent-host-death family protein n=1 Tax=Alcanivorax dieselolei (strain DSM 16502 / CGMCC 1.3690 / MCCC 1A00001 / B-5) TaxID=930169 RepID=K0C5B7_ALCDB|nr:Prevent-host-death family protein [Alloalcanivorax dieselolei B5]
MIQRFEDYERTEKELRFMKVVALGLLDAQKGDTTSVEQARGALGLE